jgi:ubiquinone/menaquinone biosynthesis C-methylase UbiE
MDIEKLRYKYLVDLLDYLDYLYDEDLVDLIFNTYINRWNEEKLIMKLQETNFYQLIKSKLIIRNKIKYNLIKDFLIKGNILDLGCGDGQFSHYIKTKRKLEIILTDILDMNETKLPFYLYDGNNLPFSKNSFNNVLLIVVLHHCDNPIGVLKEAIRVSSGQIIILEAIYSDLVEKELNKFFDWFFNKIIILKRSMNVPFNYKTNEEWLDIFLRCQNVSLIKSIDQGWNLLPLLPEHRILYVLRKTI